MTLVTSLKFNNPANPQCVLICFHHSGGNATIFRSWAKILENSDILLFGVNLPARLPSQIYHINNDTINCIISESCSHLMQDDLIHNNLIPLVLFGHSLGGIVAFEVARKLSPNVIVSHLIISSSRSPKELSIRNNETFYSPKYLMTNENLFNFILSIGGLPVGLPVQILQAYLPVIKRDLKLYETYRYNESLSNLTCPITTCVGDQDDSELLSSILQWDTVTTNSCSHEIFENGNHFYFFDNILKEKLLNLIIKICYSFI